jgi:hypothetical protein
VFPVRYELNSYILFGRNSVLMWLRGGCVLQGYFSVTVLIMGHFVHSEQLYWSGNHSQPHSDSLLEPDVTPPVSRPLGNTALTELASRPANLRSLRFF